MLAREGENDIEKDVLSSLSSQVELKEMSVQLLLEFFQLSFQLLLEI